LTRLAHRTPLEAPAPPQSSSDPFDGLGAAMQRVRAMVDRVAPTDATVLVTGESGSGKEIVAARLHERSRRAAGPLVRINCAALAESLLEAELFGYAKGAFTGADQARRGHFEAASGGTILLDEIGDVSPALQVRLLRVLQEREVTPLGTSRAVPVDFRLIAATHRDLDALVRAGRFREDLLYRLRVVEIAVPPLRDRVEEIPALAKRLLARHARRNRVAPRPLATDALAALSRHRWPGNVRELEHVLERALVLAAGDAITAADLPAEFTSTHAAASPAPRTLRDAGESLERAWIRRALRDAGGVRAQAARALGTPERVLRYKLRKYGLDGK
jgi:two-component system response regulator HydG